MTTDRVTPEAPPADAPAPRPPPLPPPGDRPAASGEGGFGWFAPALAPMLRQRKLAIAMGVMGAVQVAAGTFGFMTIPCPLLHVVGIPCPGCGASRACGAIFRGDWHTWSRMHLLAPLFLLAAALFAAAAVLPARQRDAMVAWVAGIERRTALTKLLLATLILYWIVRLLYAPAEFTRLMRG